VDQIIISIFAPVKINFKKNPKQTEMKNLVILFIVAALMAACSTKGPHYVVKGKITGADSVKFYLKKRVAGQAVNIDSAMVLKGGFTMKAGAVEYPEMVSLVSADNRKGMTFFLENSEIAITGHIDSLYDAVVTGSKAQNEYDGLNKPFNTKMMDLSKQYQVARKDNDTAKTSAIVKEFEALQKEMTQAQKDFVKNNPASYVSPVLLRNISIELSADETLGLINGLDTAVAKIQMVKDMKVRAEAMKNVEVGKKAPDFTLNDVNDQPVALYSKVGKTKLLLVDFWASWCGPCRQENPNVVKVWKEFNKKGFDVFGVSLDRPGAKDAWMQAIEKDQLTWTHVTDLKFWDCAAARLYGIGSIPANFLLDETGTIIARDLRGEELFNKVKELLAAKK
jgi:peroxiredoxin